MFGFWLPLVREQLRLPRLQRRDVSLNRPAQILRFVQASTLAAYLTTETAHANYLDRVQVAGAVRANHSDLVIHSARRSPPPTRQRSATQRARACLLHIRALPASAPTVSRRAESVPRVRRSYRGRRCG